MLCSALCVSSCRSSAVTASRDVPRSNGPRPDTLSVRTASSGRSRRRSIKPSCPPDSFNRGEKPWPSVPRAERTLPSWPMWWRSWTSATTTAWTFCCCRWMRASRVTEMIRWRRWRGTSSSMSCRWRSCLMKSCMAGPWMPSWSRWDWRITALSAVCFAGRRWIEEPWCWKWTRYAQASDQCLSLPFPDWSSMSVWDFKHSARQIMCFGVNELHCTFSTLIHLHVCLEIEIYFDSFKILWEFISDISIALQILQRTFLIML